MTGKMECMNRTVHVLNVSESLGPTTLRGGDGVEVLPLREDSKQRAALRLEDITERRVKLCCGRANCGRRALAD